MLNVTFIGPDTNFFGNAFFSFTQFPFFNVTTTSDGPGEIVMEQGGNGATTTFTGTGLKLDASNNIIAGTITGIEFAQGDDVQGTYDGMTWSAVTFYRALVEISTGGSNEIYHSLLKQQDIYFDARGAIVAPNQGGVIKGATHKFIFDGSDFGDKVGGSLGRDTLKGFKGNDVLSGKAGKDKLFGGAGKDELSGGNGNDKINGGNGADTLSGGNGADVFLYNGNRAEGRDHITDFEDGIDMIRIKGADFGDLTIRSAGRGADTKIILDSGTTIILDDVQSSTITADDFVFV